MTMPAQQTYAAATQVPRQVVQEVQTHSVPMTSYQQYQTVSQPMTMPAQQTYAAPVTTSYAAPTTSYAAPATTYATPSYGTSMIGGYGGYTGGVVGGYTGGSVIGGMYLGTIF